jgi:hypothetical protein
MDNSDDFLPEYHRCNKLADDARVRRVLLAEEVGDAEPSLAQQGELVELNRTVARSDGFKKRVIVRKFLDELFDFNPDYHVRSAYSDNPLDPERVAPAGIVSDIPDTDKKGKKVRRTKTIVSKTGERKVIELGTKEIEERSTSKFVKHIPPSDTFHRWNHYTDVNYEEIRSATNDLYCEKPDLEFAINPYDQFTTEDGAKKFIQKHKDEVIADIVTLHNGKWNLTGSFKKNRDRINFYNEKTEVIEKILGQIGEDKKLGRDLMRKRVKRVKQKNIEEVGEDPEALIKYKKEHTSGFEALGAENVNDEKESKPTFSISPECPYDAVQVDMFTISGGGTKVEKSEFFTQAEDPDTSTIGLGPARPGSDPNA